MVDDTYHNFLASQFPATLEQGHNNNSKNETENLHTTFPVEHNKVRLILFQIQFLDATNVQKFNLHIDVRQEKSESKIFGS